jgi:DNA ligase-associated metallophosphoesterase
MTTRDAEVEVAGARLVLLAERALWWPARGTLVVADLHLGKAATFRAAGIPIPRGSTTDDLARLDRALERTGAESLVILGDLFHARVGREAPATLALLGGWRARRHALDVLLVRGNHDVGAGDPPTELGVRCVDEPWEAPPFQLRHHPEASTAYVLAGHVHPAVRLGGHGGLSERLPAFVFGERVGLLPAFGSFTGGGHVPLAPGDRVYVIAEDEVLAATARTSRPPAGT